MKKIFIILALAMVSFANAQKGTILLAGSVGVDGTKNTVGTTENKTTTFNFSPKVGYQFTDNWTLGIEASIEGSKGETSTVNGGGILVTSTTKNTGMKVGPFVRYTKPLSEMFSAYVDMGIGFNSGKTTVESPVPPFGTVTTTQKGNGVYVGVTPAIFINVKKNFGLNFSIGGLGYETFNLSNNQGDNNRFYVNFGQTVNIGISKNF